MRFRKVVPGIRLVVSTPHHVAQIAPGAKPQRDAAGNKGRTLARDTMNRPYSKSRSIATSGTSAGGIG